MQGGNPRRVTTAVTLGVALVVSIVAAGALIAADQVQPAKAEGDVSPAVKKTVLTNEDARRIGIETALLKEDTVKQRIVVLGQVAEALPTAPAGLPETGGTAASSDLPAVQSQPALQSTDALTNPLRVRVLVDAQEDAQEDDTGGYDDEDDAEVFAPDNDEDEEPLHAQRVKFVSADPATSDIIYFRVISKAHSLKPGQSVGVRMAKPGSDMPRKVVPYSAVIYDAKGDAFVYTNPEPLVFMRAPVTIDYIDQGLAVLDKGPDVGTKVVTVGAAELYGAEAGATR